MRTFIRKAGFSNLIELLARIDVTAPAKEETHLLRSPASEMVLEISWNPKTECLGLRIVDAGDVKFMRVGLLSKTVSLFDPMGTAAPLVVKAKIQLCELGTRGLPWHGEVTNEASAWWTQWFVTLPLCPAACSLGVRTC